MQTQVDGRTLWVDIEYPRSDENIDKVIVELCDVRASDPIRVSYDFERDGWKVEQMQVFAWPLEDGLCDPGWIEVAFIQAWGSAKHNPLEGDGCPCAECARGR